MNQNSIQLENQITGTKIFIVFDYKGDARDLENMVSGCVEDGLPIILKRDKQTYIILGKVYENCLITIEHDYKLSL